MIYQFLSDWSPVFDFIGAISVVTILVLYLKDSINWSILMGYRPTIIVFAGNFAKAENSSSPCVLMMQREDLLGGEWGFLQASYTNEDPNIAVHQCMQASLGLSVHNWVVKTNLDLGRIFFHDRVRIKGIRRQGFSFFETTRGKHYIAYVVNIDSVGEQSLAPGCEIAKVKMFTVAEVREILQKSEEEKTISKEKGAMIRKGFEELVWQMEYYHERKAKVTQAKESSKSTSPELELELEPESSTQKEKE